MIDDGLPPAADLEADAAYNSVDCLVTTRVAKRMDSEGLTKPSLFDQALLGPSLTCQLRGLRVDRGRMEEAKTLLAKQTRARQDAFEKATGGWKWGKSSKPAPQQLARALYEKMGVRIRLSRDMENPTVAHDVLVDILNDTKTPEIALPVVEIALQLADLEEDRKALEKPLSPDGRMRSSFMVAGTISGRWASRKDCFGDGLNLHSASDIIRKIFVPDPGYIMVSMDQMQGESYLLGFLAGSQWYIDAHESGNVHVDAGRIFFPEYADVICKSWAKETKWPFTSNDNFYDIMKRLQHANNYMQSPKGVAHHLRIPIARAKTIQQAYFQRIPEIKRYHEWVAAEIKRTRRMVSPLGRVRQYLGRTWEDTVIREAISWQPQSGVSDITKALLWRMWHHLDPHHLQVFLDHHDSVLFQVPEGKLDSTLAEVNSLCDIPIPIGPRVMRARWETKMGHSWGEV